MKVNLCISRTSIVEWLRLRLSNSKRIRYTCLFICCERICNKGAPADRVKQLEAGMMKAMSHNYYKNFLTEIGLDETSVVGADEWGKQMEEML